MLLRSVGIESRAATRSWAGFSKAEDLHIDTADRPISWSAIFVETCRHTLTGRKHFCTERSTIVCQDLRGIKSNRTPQTAQGPTKFPSSPAPQFKVVSRQLTTPSVADRPRAISSGVCSCGLAKFTRKETHHFRIPNRKHAPFFALKSRRNTCS